MVHEGGPLVDVEFSTEIDLSQRDRPTADPPSRLSDPDLFARIDAYAIGPADTELSFASRLARENDWSDGYAAEVIGEYKRFIYLICISAGSLTPSRDVDEVWHLHLTYSRDYWERFCRDTLNRDLHHTPTEGGPTEAGKFYDLYNDTLRSYEAEFGVRPQLQIWPDPKFRFSETTSPVKVAADRHFFFKKDYGASLLIACVAIFFAGGTIGSAYPNEFYPAMFFIFLIFLVGALLVATLPIKGKAHSGVSAGCGSSPSGCNGASGCGGGGCGGGD
ncbi:glycine-rich domain-containing protein [Mesorhizobium sp. IMUNJ 23232]|uniref:glycine-rich domain-containing protein n=1 Tax=Mesorhizobium sp. IMUNJ 23232 TaxID=3376064 RepID=UPI0037A16E50